MKVIDIKKLHNKVYNNDARDILQTLGENIRVKSTITSPPYFDMKDYGSDNQIGFGQNYDEYLNDLKTIFDEIYHITETDGSLWIIIDSFKRNSQVITLPFDLSNKLKEIGWLLQDIIIWKKDKTVPWSKKGFVQRKFEYILFFTKTNNFKYNKDKVRNFDTEQLKKWWVKYPERYNPRGKALDEIWEFPIPTQGSWGSKYVRHFCPLPKEMVARMIELSTDPNDLILDPFAGSGSVLFQSTVMKRKYIGFELNKDYIQMFNEYLISNKEMAENEYARLKNSENQEDFRNMILNLRALKYGRLLVNEIDKTLNFDLKVYVAIAEYLDDHRIQMIVEYKFMGENINFESLLDQIKIIISKPPYTKFGIKPLFSITESKNFNAKKYCTYTKTNSYSYSHFPVTSAKVKVISEICVNLNENDYS